MNRIEELKDECLKKNGQPRKDCDREKLMELVTLQAEKPDGPIIAESPEDSEKLKKEYDKVVEILFDRSDPDEIKLKPGSSEKNLARFYVLKDMIRQPAPEPSRITTKQLPDDVVEVKVSPGPPVWLQGKNKEGWKRLAQVMPQGGRVRVKGYSAFRISRGTARTPYIAPPRIDANPNKKKASKNKPKFDI